MALVSLDAIPFELQGDAIVPMFLSTADEPWLSLLVEVFERFAGEPRKKLDEHLRRGLPFDAPERKLRLAIYVLRRLWRTKVVADVPPKLAREELFCRAAGCGRERAHAVAETAAELGVSAEALEAALFADLPEQRRLLPPKEAACRSLLRLRANLILVQGLLERCTQVRIQMNGNARPVVRFAKLRGLICSMLADAVTGAVRLEVSGPLSLFKRTLVYGRALGELVPQLSWCNQFYLEADIPFGSRSNRLILSTGAPILPSREPKRYDSQLEERFARDFVRVTDDWDLIREPEPIPVARSLIFPDFAVVRRSPPFDRWLLEIVGFWTADYLERKLAMLDLANVSRLILCVDEERGCSERDLPQGAHLVRFRKRIDVNKVLEVLERQ